MWVRLESNEIKRILEILPEGRLADKLREPADSDADAFLNAVETADELEVDPDAVVSRGEDGAFVMSWVWVSNEKAGLEQDPDDDGSDELYNGTRIAI
ncbi:hypothetical protein [Agrobacterium pusense]|uniref:hypothetical protein n=1 Tax=Agrobacterium pusense TaxID=648995 RepID=UPI000D3AD2D1|nr:hypothetical protein [Agrobacterium pusense]PTV69796.1 hypothetical protein DBL06_25775 [Agrobacterium pusense]